MCQDPDDYGSCFQASVDEGVLTALDWSKSPRGGKREPLRFSPAKRTTNTVSNVYAAGMHVRDVYIKSTRSNDCSGEAVGEADACSETVIAPSTLVFDNVNESHRHTIEEGGGGTVPRRRLLREMWTADTGDYLEDRIDLSRKKKA